MIRRKDASLLAAEAERRCIACGSRHPTPEMDESGVHRDALGAASRIGILGVYLFATAFCLGAWYGIYLLVRGWLS